MALARRRWSAELLHVWFHRLRPADWFSVNEQVDAELCRRFEREWRALRLRPPREFLTDPQVALASVLLFDQIPRNLFRGSPLAFRTDPLARAITWGTIARGFDEELTRRERQFLAMPLMHSEEIADQLASLRYFASLGPGFGFDFARSHHKMIARFGRFPHRNEVLGRATTPAEQRAIAAGFRW